MVTSLSLLALTIAMYISFYNKSVTQNDVTVVQKIHTKIVTKVEKKKAENKAWYSYFFGVIKN